MGAGMGSTIPYELVSAEMLLSRKHRSHVTPEGLSTEVARVG
jgi:hypothetical protein